MGEWWRGEGKGGMKGGKRERRGGKEGKREKWESKCFG